jgi:hypothetical protein
MLTSGLRDRVLWVIPRHRYPSATGAIPAAESRTRARLQAVYHGTEPVDPRTAGLCALRAGCRSGVAGVYGTAAREVRVRLAEIAETGGQAMRCARRSLTFRLRSRRPPRRRWSRRQALPDTMVGADRSAATRPSKAATVRIRLGSPASPSQVGIIVEIPAVQSDPRRSSAAATPRRPCSSAPGRTVAAARSLILAYRACQSAAASDSRRSQRMEGFVRARSAVGPRAGQLGSSQRTGRNYQQRASYRKADAGTGEERCE